MIVEVVFHSFDFLIGFVSFSCHKNHVAGLCHRGSSANRLSSVGDVESLGALLVVESGQHVVDNVFRALKSRII